MASYPYHVPYPLTEQLVCWPRFETIPRGRLDFLSLWRCFLVCVRDLDCLPEHPGCSPLPYLGGFAALSFDDCCCSVVLSDSCSGSVVGCFSRVYPFSGFRDAWLLVMSYPVDGVPFDAPSLPSWVR